ncbi:DMT family transporter [Leucobacter weissii]|uniref:DMT family transporter n=1 Tax=Leucobacter weissii TaxID=1983706 RepID=A0A939MQC3_9MICO|nr:DMT family transporter [Leucobacter weissii]MBO1903002.1 DMT family transporter [Leucobacter weissii]
MIGLALAFLSSALWGAADFAAGLGARRSDALRTSLLTYLLASSLLVIVHLLDPGRPSASAITGGLIAAVCSAVGFVSFYVSLALAPMGVVTAIVAATEVVVPVVVGVGVHGEPLSVLSWAGAATAAIGAVVVGAAEGSGARDRGSVRTTTRALLLAAIAGVAFGLAVVALDLAPPTSGMLAPSLEMVGGLVITGALLAIVFRSERARRIAGSVGVVTAVRLDRHGAILGALAGGLQGAANIVLMLALWNGDLAVVGVIVCLYPVTTAILARFVLGERLARAHLVGIGLALGGCVLLALAA